MITLLHISDSDKHFTEAIQEYIKRLGKHIKIEKIKPVKHGSQQEIIVKETKIIQEKIKKYPQYHKILLSIKGKILTTEEFNTTRGNHNHLLYIIGGPYGLDETQLTVDQKIAFGKMTMPHGLIKTVLLEQIYRSRCIDSGKKYHY